MKKNRIILLITLLLAIVAIIVIATQSSNTLRNKNNDFAIEDSSIVTKIFLLVHFRHGTCDNLFSKRIRHRIRKCIRRQAI